MTEATTPSASIRRAGGRDVLWDPDFAARSPYFAGLAPALEALGRHDAFPSPEAIDEALSGLAGVRFVRQAPRPRRERRGSQDPKMMYDTRIVEEGLVPTRNASWHDLLNALVWATFPRAKLALHTRQSRLVVLAKPGQSLRRPRELDALALLDEGGILLEEGTEPPGGAASPSASGGAARIFGHAVYEGLVLGWPAPVSAGFRIPADPCGPDADPALAAILGDPARLKDPTELRRVPLDRA